MLIPMIFTGILVVDGSPSGVRGFSVWNRKTFAAMTPKSPEGDFSALVNERFLATFSALV